MKFLEKVSLNNISGMIRGMSGTAQYICTTFRPELIEHANKFYGVTYKNKVSIIVYFGYFALKY